MREKVLRRPRKNFWRSLQDHDCPPWAREHREREFLEGASEFLDPVGRRDFLKLSSAALALAGASACTRQPNEIIVPYVQPPEEAVPGEPLYFATSVYHQGIASPVLVESHMARPTKVEGNPEHPVSRGASDIFTQASILELYDPDRSQVVTNAGAISTWSDFLTDLRSTLAVETARQGVGIRLLTSAVTSPLVARQIEEVLSRFPRARWHVYEPADRDSVWTGTERSFGERLEPRYHFAEADVVLALDADVLAPGPRSIVHARDLAARRDPDHERGMNRIYAVEPVPSLLGAKADHRLRLSPSAVARFALELARELGLDVPPGGESSTPANWLRAVATDLERHRGRSLIVAGEHQPPAVHALANALNVFLDNVGTTADYHRPVEHLPGDYPGSMESLRALVDDMGQGNVELLIVAGSNPVYDAPADLGFTEALDQVSLRVHLGLYDDETAALCHWHIPEAHPLESWGDGRAFEGTVTFHQPLIEPLYGGKTASQLLAALLGRTGVSSHDLLREHWQQEHGENDFENFWRRAIHDGFLQNSALPSREVALREGWSRGLELEAPAPEGELDVVFRPDPTIFDGRYANNAWLQETPKPFTKLTWDNAVLVSPETARRLGLANEELVELRLDGRSQTGAVWILPGQADNVLCLGLGYGRRRAGRVGMGAGFDFYRIRSFRAPWHASGVAIEKMRRHYPLAQTQDHRSMEGRGLLREASLDDFRDDPHFAHHGHHEPPDTLSLYPEPERKGDYAWGMSIDLGKCTGCNACLVACQAENNIPAVGKAQVRLGREMHWIRVDGYFEGDPQDPRFHHQPVPCMHCENAPCEVVCPVAATVHTPEGLNAMVYNRCVGTRYCSNNCPYKVRRFNFLHYADYDTPVRALGNNPDVTVRTRGVMEKCTYCVQRINAARIEAKKEDRTIRDGEVVTACQGACPAQAIVFGDIDDPQSAVAGAKANPRNYAILAELGTRPRTTYLAKVRNPNGTLEPATDEGGAH